MIFQARAISSVELTVSRLLKWSALVALASFATAVCGAAPLEQKDIRAQRLAQMEELKRLCGLPEGVLRLDEKDRVLLTGSIDKIPFAAVSCAWEMHERIGIPRGKFGFVAGPPLEGPN